MVRPILPVLAVALLAGCPPPTPVVPTRPTERMARVDVEINNSPSSADDYVIRTTATPGRARVINAAALASPSPIPVTLKNLDFQTTAHLVFAANGTPAATTLDLDLPADGSWANFVTAGAEGQLSARDKDAVIEVLERRANGIVLARKSLMVTNAVPVAAGSPIVEIYVGYLETIDDYIAWRPSVAHVRVVPGTVDGDLAVTVRNMSPLTASWLVFGPFPAFTPTVQPPPMSSTLALTLPANGQWVNFFVSGAWSLASRNDKDAVIEVVRASNGALLAREGLMVRIRRDAQTLQTNERERYLNAVARLNLSLGLYVVHQLIHRASVPIATAGEDWRPQAHGIPGFLPWHRAMLLRYERELQAIDPAVALPYWKFDAIAPSVFSAFFMGGPPSGGNATFFPNNPLSAWTIQGISGIARNPSFNPAQFPSGILSDGATLGLGGNPPVYSSLLSMEGNPHGRAHTQAGGFGGWLTNVTISVRDPIFFMLHGNVDRLWAQWQWLFDRENPASVLSYSPQGSYAGGPFGLGMYLDDTMWPWDLRTGHVTASDALTWRPTTAPGGSMPAAVGGWGPVPTPKNRDMIDFDQWSLIGQSGLNYGYDVVPFRF